jgi:hypothetical protein
MDQWRGLRDPSSGPVRQSRLRAKSIELSSLRVWYNSGANGGYISDRLTAHWALQQLMCSRGDWMGQVGSAMVVLEYPPSPLTDALWYFHELNSEIVKDIMRIRT